MHEIEFHDARVAKLALEEENKSGSMHKRLMSFPKRERIIIGRLRILIEERGKEATFEQIMDAFELWKEKE